MSLSRQYKYSDAYFYAQPSQATEPSIDHVAMPRMEQYPPRRQVKSAYRKQAHRLPKILYWVILAAMLVCIFQCVRTVMVELYKMAVLVKNEPVIERYYQETLQENRILQDRIKSAASPEGIEAMARNDLNLTSEQEILVRLH